MIKVKEILFLEDVKKELLEFCLQAPCRPAILEHILNAENAAHYHQYIGPLLAKRYLKTDFREKRSVRSEKYLITQKCLNYLKAVVFLKRPALTSL